MPAGYNPHRRVAIIFDFDDTLVPDSASLLLKKYGIAPKQFWKTDAANLVGKGYDPTMAWLKLLLDRIGEGKPFGNLCKADLRSFGVRLRRRLFPGLESLPRALKRIARDFGWRADLYVVSGGLEEIIVGLPFIRENFTAVYGTRLEEGGTPPRLQSIKRAITFTEKTRYLFEINKGITPEQTLEKPYAVNEEVAAELRPVPFDCMIYVGDGLTDIPCFSLVDKNGGFPFGVFDPRRRKEARTAFEEMLIPRRTYGVYSPRYGAKDDLGSHLRNTVIDICGRESIGR